MQKQIYRDNYILLESDHLGKIIAVANIKKYILPWLKLSAIRDCQSEFCWLFQARHVKNSA